MQNTHNHRKNLSREYLNAGVLWIKSDRYSFYIYYLVQHATLWKIR
jgi:hypothetical protein